MRISELGYINCLDPKRVETVGAVGFRTVLEEELSDTEEAASPLTVARVPPRSPCRPPHIGVCLWGPAGKHQLPGGGAAWW